MKVDCDNIADIAIICSFWITFLYSPILLSQGEFSSQLSSDFILSESFDWNITGEQVIWGTRWHSIKVEKSLHTIPGARIGGSWSGWEAWKRNEIWWGQEKLIGVVEDDIVIYTKRTTTRINKQQEGSDADCHQEKHTHVSSTGN